MSTERFKNVTSCFVINLLNSKTIILLKLAEYCLILAYEAVVSDVIIQQIVTLSKYGHNALDICHP